MTEEEFKAAVMPHNMKMMAEAMRILKNRDKALDCLQDAFTALWKSRDGLSDISNVSAYCIKATVNRAIVMQRRESEPSVESEVDIPSDDTPLKKMEQAEKTALLRQAVKLLPEIERKIIVMRALKGMSSDEIAHTMGLTPANVRVILHRGRKKLKDYLDKHYGL